MNRRVARPIIASAMSANTAESALAAIAGRTWKSAKRCTHAAFSTMYSGFPGGWLTPPIIPMNWNFAESPRFTVPPTPGKSVARYTTAIAATARSSGSAARSRSLITAGGRTREVTDERH